MHGEEMAATEWAVAAVTHLGLPLNLVFHEEGYRGGSNNLIDAFSQGKGFGFPLLVAWEITDSEKGSPLYAKMDQRNVTALINWDFPKHRFP